MYSTKNIQKLIDKVNKEAGEAAQLVYNKYNDVLLQAIKNQMHENDTLYVANGTALLERGDASKFDNKLADIAASAVFGEEISAGFYLPYKIQKNKK